MAEAQEQGGGKAQVSIDANEDYFQPDAAEEQQYSSSLVEQSGTVQRLAGAPLVSESYAGSQVIPAVESPASYKGES
jgi:hypothetical protein